MDPILQLAEDTFGVPFQSYTRGPQRVLSAARFDCSWGYHLGHVTVRHRLCRGRNGAPGVTVAPFATNEEIKCEFTRRHTIENPFEMTEAAR